MAASSYFGDSPLFLMDYLLRILRVIVLLSVWRTLFARGGTQSGLTLPILLTYTLIAEAFAEQLEASTDVAGSFWGRQHYNTLQQAAWRVRAVYRGDMRQMGVQFWHVFSSFAACRHGNGHSPVSGEPCCRTAVRAKSHSGGCGQFLRWISCLPRSASRCNSRPSRWNACALLLRHCCRAHLFPSPLLPWNLGRVFGWLPFASTASAPLRIYTGTGDPAPLLALQLLWAVLLWPLAVWLWRKNQEKMVAYGG